MQYLAGIWIEGFYASEGEGLTVIHREGSVLDATLEAQAAGVAVGMTLREAKSVIQGEVRWQEWEEDVYAERARQWFDLLTAFSDVVEPVDQHLAFVDLSGHPRPREAAARLHQRLVKAGFRAHIGLARSRWVAMLAARQGDPVGLAHADPAAYVARLPVGRLPIPEVYARTFELLGYRTAGEIAVLDERVVRTQCGTDTPRVMRAARGEGESEVAALYPPAMEAGRFVYDGPPEDRDTLEAGLAILVDQLAERLVEKDLSGKRVELVFEKEDATPLPFARTFARTISTKRDLWNAVRLLLPETFEHRVESVRLRLPKLKSARRVQRDIEGGIARAEREESVRLALLRVRGTFGDSAVLLGKDVPEPRHVMLRRAFQEANGYAWNA